MKCGRLKATQDYFVDVQDDAALHLAAAILPDVKGERLFAFAFPMNWDMILEILRKQNPGRKFADNFHAEEYPVIVKPIARAESLLRRIGRPGWITMEGSIAGNTAHLKKTTNGHTNDAVNGA